ncbi:hypothetical protein IQ264_14610 [Phormidium sp. LEGE 05292]|uniref:hypothetical protein n=1 Tax=[Phormidium] sp. LEGE 05292 TaxID=767427 RepID=UPI0018800450|nr:hypothetical protein [Phormidium sp. LEGE 05292]MBE9226656.1 hypothetical protein [Phormidium sp. LEGE 05292]
MSLINLVISLILGMAAFWTYCEAKAEPPTNEIVCACAVVIFLLSFVWFVVSAPWVLNLALLIALLTVGK